MGKLSKVSRKKNEKPLEGMEEKAEFYLEFLTPAQKLAWKIYQEHDIVFLLGAAGTGKSYLSTAFALQDINERRKSKVVLTRPIVEAGENLGFLPGTLNEKVDPYMAPLYDCISKITGGKKYQYDMLMSKVVVSPLAYMRGVTFTDSVCILDEAQNCTWEQLILFLTRMGINSKMLITGDPEQSDLYHRGNTPLMELVSTIQTIQGIGIVEFAEKHIVRHGLVGKILKRIKEKRQSVD
jgi:phosphate starvation-inducible PhoH-like protein